MKKNDIISPVLERYRKLRFCILIMLVILVASTAFVFLNKTITFSLVTVAVLYHLLFLRKEQKKYSQMVTEANLQSTICPYLGANTIDTFGGGTISSHTLKAAHLMPIRETKGSPLLCYGIHGQKDGLSVSICDATIAQDFQLKEKGRKRVHFNSGTWVHIDFSKPKNDTWCLLDETSVPTPIRMAYFTHIEKRKTSPIGDDTIGNRCVLYPKSNESCTLSPSLLHEIKRLLEYTPGYLAISVHETAVDFFLRGRFLSRPVSLSKAPTEKLLSFDPFPELAYLIRIAKAL